MLHGWLAQLEIHMLLGSGGTAKMQQRTYAVKVISTRLIS
jgi:hypothetical protein